MGITIWPTGQTDNRERLIYAAKDIAETFKFGVKDYEAHFEPQPMNISWGYRCLPNSKEANLTSHNGKSYHVYRAKRGTPYNSQIAAEVRRLLHDDRPPRLMSPPLHIKGVMVDPHPDCETLELTFDQFGVLGSWNQLWCDPKTKAGDTYLSVGRVFCKTQFAGPKLHLIMLEYLRNLEPYFTYFSLHDEAKVWPLLKRGHPINSPAVVKRAYRSWGEMDEVFRHVFGTLKQLGYDEAQMRGAALEQITRRQEEAN